MLQRIDSREPVLSVRSAEARTDSTASIPPRYQTWPGGMRSSKDVANQNASARITLGISENAIPCGNNEALSYTPYPHCQEAFHGAETYLARARVVPHRVSCGLTDQSEGKPLATITEQRSLSTLNSGISQFSSKCPNSNPRVANDAPSLGTSGRSCGGLGERRVHQIEKRDGQLRSAGEVIDDHVRTYRHHQASDSACRTTGPNAGNGFVHQLAEASAYIESKGWKGLLREVAQHARRASRRSESKPSCSYWSEAEGHTSRTRDSNRSASNGHGGVPRSTCSGGGPSFEDPQNDIRAALSNHFLPSPRQHDRTSIPVAACGRDESTPRRGFVDATALRDEGPSDEHEGSICSSLSTNYSSTVLGVDLDLQHYPNTTPRRSSSASMWFTTQECATRDMQRGRYTVTSSALPVLLPLAAASGIVKQNHSPPFSFYSLSGNLIQAVEGWSESKTAFIQEASLDFAKSGKLPSTTISRDATPTKTAERTSLPRSLLQGWSSILSSRSDEQATKSAGALAAQTLRLCFCQPHDLEDPHDWNGPRALGSERHACAHVVRKSVDNGSERKAPTIWQGRRTSVVFSS
jgi:hypothetical protein